MTVYILTKHCLLPKADRLHLKVEHQTREAKKWSGGMADGSVWHANFEIRDGENEKVALLRHFEATLDKQDMKDMATALATSVEAH